MVLDSDKLCFARVEESLDDVTLVFWNTLKNNSKVNSKLQFSNKHAQIRFFFKKVPHFASAEIDLGLFGLEAI